MPTRTAIAFLMASFAISSAHAADPGCRKDCWLLDLKHGKELAIISAGDLPRETVVDTENAYHRAHGDRSIQKWSITPVPGDPDYYTLMTNGYRLASADPSDGRLHLRSPDTPIPDTQRWRFVQMKPGSYVVVDKASRNFLGLAAPEAYDGHVYHRYSPGPQTLWRVLGGTSTQLCPQGTQLRKDTGFGAVICDPDPFVADVAKLTAPNQLRELAAWHGLDQAFKDYTAALGQYNHWKQEQDSANRMVDSADCRDFKCPVATYRERARTAGAEMNTYAGRMSTAKAQCRQHAKAIADARAAQKAANERQVSLRIASCP